MRAQMFVGGAGFGIFLAGAVAAQAWQTRVALVAYAAIIAICAYYEEDAA